MQIDDRFFPFEIKYKFLTRGNKIDKINVFRQRYDFTV